MLQLVFGLGWVGRNRVKVRVRVDVRVRFKK